MEENAQVQAEGAAADEFEVEFAPFGIGEAVAAGHLPQSGDAGFASRMAAAEAIHRGCRGFVKTVEVRTK